MKGKEFAALYNAEPDKQAALNAIQNNYILEFKRLMKVRKAKDIHEIANVYCELENKWMAFCLRVNEVAEETYHDFMREAIPVLSMQILKYLEAPELFKPNC